jgi:hypothetical protein
MIGPGGLLLVVSHLFAIPVVNFMARVGKKEKNLNLDVRNIFAGSPKKTRK